MPLSKLLLSYILTFVVFFIIDMTWLGFIAKDLYRKHLGGFLSDQVNWTAAFIFYILFIVGVFIFTSRRKKFTDIRNNTGCTIWLFYLCYLWFNQFGNFKRMAVKYCIYWYYLGHHFNCNCEYSWFSYCKIFPIKCWLLFFK